MYRSTEKSLFISLTLFLRLKRITSFLKSLSLCLIFTLYNVWILFNNDSVLLNSVHLLTSSELHAESVYAVKPEIPPWLMYCVTNWPYNQVDNTY